MKRTHLILLVIYIISVLYFAVFNWEMFLITLNVNLGFSIINIPLIVAIFLYGICFLLIQWGLVNIYKLKTERDLARKDSEIKLLKSAQYDNQASEIQKHSATLDELNSKLNKVMEKLEIDIKKQAVTEMTETIKVSEEEIKPEDEQKS